MAQGMKRLGMPIAALIGVVLIGLMAMSWFLNRDALRQAVEAQIRAVTGLELVVNGRIDVSVFPGSYVSFHDVGLKGGGDGEPALSVDVLTANLRLLPLLLRRFEIADVMMLRPHIRVVRTADGQSNWTPFLDTLTRTMKPGADDPLSFSKSGSRTASLAIWTPPTASRKTSATSTCRWHGRRSRAPLPRPGNSTGAASVSTAASASAISSPHFRRTLRPEGADIRAPLKVALDSARQPRQHADGGHAHRRQLSLRNALRWTGRATHGTGGFGRFALKARANVVGPSIALTNVNIELDGNVAEGVMTYANNGRQTLQATLAAGALDFTPYVSTVRLLAGGQRYWNRQLFDLSSLTGTDLDMRLSAAKVTVGKSTLGRTALGANLRSGTLALSVGEAQMYGGIARGSFNVARSDAVVNVKAQFQFINVDL